MTELHKAVKKLLKLAELEIAYSELKRKGGYHEKKWYYEDSAKWWTEYEQVIETLRIELAKTQVSEVE
jgi:hypothetical protein